MEDHSIIDESMVVIMLPGVVACSDNLSRYVRANLVTSHACRSFCDQDQNCVGWSEALDCFLISGSNHEMIAMLFYHYLHDEII